ncbi:MAG TPA: HDIG domain-containing protein, partial [Pirellulales bacterium]|nr:HDIG domain-containing protein [Pirellulales bacterium]
MSTAGRKKPSKTGRVASLELPPGRFERFVDALKRGGTLLRLSLCVVCAVSLWGVTKGWAPPFSFREGFVPNRDVTARLPFKQPDPSATAEAKRRAASREPVVYRQDAKGLQLLRASLQHALAEIAAANTLAELNAEVRRQFFGPAAVNGDVTPAPADVPLPDSERDEEDFQAFRASLGGAMGLAAIDQGLASAFARFEQFGLLEKLPEEHGEGNRQEIAVYPIGRPSDERFLVTVPEVLVGDASLLERRLKDNLPADLVGPVFRWLRPRLKSTLEFDENATQDAREKAIAKVPEQYKYFEPRQVLAPAGQVLDAISLRLLWLEHQAYIQHLGWTQYFERSVAVFGLLATLFGLCGYYLYYHERKIVTDLFRLVTLLVAALAAVLLVQWTSADPWRAELIPLLLFGMTLAIAYHRDVALLLSVALALVLVTATGHGLGEFMIMMSVVASAIVQLSHIRNRSKLIKVGAISAVVALACSLGVGLLDEQPLDWPLVSYGARNALWTLAAGFLLTGLLPMIEKLFGVLTEISLLEWSDISHPLLQELVRRAPGTYNHSINVASIAEAAAESIGACGLLVRVGAYFHDIGKMLKPHYFTENQTPGSNKHDTLMPAMSTLIIIAHVKDGADLARQHDLPQPIIDFVEQHHGTTLVEYFYQRANEKSEADPNGSDVEESSYRYPGPKPQTVEAAVLMLADAVE